MLMLMLCLMGIWRRSKHGRPAGLPLDWAQRVRDKPSELIRRDAMGWQDGMKIESYDWFLPGRPDPKSQTYSFTSMFGNRSSDHILFS